MFLALDLPLGVHLNLQGVNMQLGPEHMNWSLFGCFLGPELLFSYEPPSKSYTQWIDLRENLQETIDFPMKYGVFL